MIFGRDNVDHGEYGPASQLPPPLLSLDHPAFGRGPGGYDPIGRGQRGRGFGGRAARGSGRGGRFGRGGTDSYYGRGEAGRGGRGRYGSPPPPTMAGSVQLAPWQQQQQHRHYQSSQSMAADTDNPMLSNVLGRQQNVMMLHQQHNSNNNSNIPGDALGSDRGRWSGAPVLEPGAATNAPRDVAMKAPPAPTLFVSMQQPQPLQSSSSSSSLLVQRPDFAQENPRDARHLAATALLQLPQRHPTAADVPPPPRPQQPQAPPPPPPASPPPEPSEPSGLVLALTRLSQMEAEMDYAYAKHMQLMAKQRLLRVQYETLENLPVGIEALQDELDRLMQVDDAKEREEEEESASTTTLVS
jgi:hypothetical protein